jgi:hypothetical protein
MAHGLLPLLVVLLLAGCGSKTSTTGNGATGKPTGKPSITATPNPVPAGPEKTGSTTIAWETGDRSKGEVYMSRDGGPEKLFAGLAPRGSQKAAWIGKGVYEFRLYAGKEHQTVLASVKVTREEK